MVENAAARAIRLLDLVPFLVANPGIQVKEVAKAFGVMPNEILRDLDLLFMCGLPGYTPLELIDLSVDDGIISVREPQNLGLPRRFSEAEALTLRIALSALEEILPVEKRATVRELRERIAAIFNRDIPKSALFYQGDVDNEKMKIIDQAISQNLKLKINYHNALKSQTTERVISILKVVADPDRTLIEAWDDTSSGPRTFNLAEIVDLDLLDEPAAKIDGFETDSPPRAEIRASSDSFFISANSSQVSPISSDHFSIEVFQPEWLVRSALAEGGEIEVLVPASVRERISEIAERALRNYKEQRT